MQAPRKTRTPSVTTVARLRSMVEHVAKGQALDGRFFSSSRDKHDGAYDRYYRTHGAARSRGRSHE